MDTPNPTTPPRPTVPPNAPKKSVQFYINTQNSSASRVLSLE